MSRYDDVRELVAKKYHKEQQYRFKHSKVKGRDYLQIFRGNDFVMSCGHADALREKLVRLDYLEGQANKYEELRTNFNEGVAEQND